MSQTDLQDRTSAIPLTDERRVRELVSNAVMGLWSIVNDLTRLRPSRQGRYRVTIFGSARARPGTFVYEQTKRISRSLTELGCDIVTGGGPGLMSAANEGASEAQAGGQQRSVGIRVTLPFEQTSNAFVTDVYEHQTFFTRLHHFVLTSDAYVIAPGGIGTVLEATMIWQLLQVGHLKGPPLIFVGPMWSELVEWARKHMLHPALNLVSPEDLDLPTCVPDGDGVVDIVRVHHARWAAGLAQPEGEAAPH